MSDRAIHRITALVVFAVGFVTYVQTMPPVTAFWDAGEFVATSYVLGIPHSPGTPLYVLVGRVFSMLPLPLTIAERVNLLSALCGALGVLMAYLVTVSVLRFMYGRAAGVLGRVGLYGGAAVGSFFLMFSHTYWVDATEAEVYALSAFVMGFCTWLALRWYENPTGGLGKGDREALAAGRTGKELEAAVEGAEREGRAHSRNLVLLIIYLLSLGIGFHLGTIIVYGGIFLLFLVVRGKAFSNFELLIFTFGMAVVVADMTLHRQSQLTLVGLAIFAILVVWSTVSEGRFALYATLLFVLGVSVHLFLMIRSSQNPFIDEVDPETWHSLYAHLRREQYPPINPFVRKASFLWQLRHFWEYFVQNFRVVGGALGRIDVGALSAAVPAALGLYGIWTNYVRERRTWVLNFASLALNSIGLILFLNFSDSEVRERDYFYGGAFYFFAIFIGIGAGSLLLSMVERAKERVEAGRVIAVGVVLLVLSVVPGWTNWFEHDRSRNYIPRNYAYNMLAGLEPDAILFTNGDNDTFPLWYIQAVEGFRTDVRVVNMMLLNTPWYIRQLRDNEPRVPVSLTDRDIDNLRPVQTKDGVLWMHDRAVMHILQETNWKRPIYFAVTIPPEKWQRYSDYLEMEGMVRRLVSTKGKYQLSEFMVKRNFNDIWKFDGVLTGDWEIDDSVYRDKDTRESFINYGVAAFRLGQELGMKKRYREAIGWLEISLKLDPDLDWANKLLGTYLLLDGEPQDAIDLLVKAIRDNPTDGDYWMRLASVYESQGNMSASLQNLLEGARLAPDNRELYRMAVRAAALTGQRQTAKDLVRRWLERHPNDREFMQVDSEIDQFFEEMQADSASGTDSGGAR